MVRLRSLAATFSSVRAFAATLVRSNVSRARSAVGRFWLWQLMQYRSSVARPALSEVEGPAFSGAEAPAPSEVEGSTDGDETGTADCVA